MKLLLLFLSSLAMALTSCSVSPGGPGVDAEVVRPLLPGTWTSKKSVRGADFYMEKTFYPDGTAKGFIDIRSGEPGVSLLLPRTPFRSRWKFDDQGNLVTYQVETGNQQLFEKDWKCHDRILRASPKRIDFIDQETGERGTFLRKSDSQPGPTAWSL